MEKPLDSDPPSLPTIPRSLPIGSSYLNSSSPHSQNYDFATPSAVDKVKSATNLNLASFSLLPTINQNPNFTTNQEKSQNSNLGSTNFTTNSLNIINSQNPNLGSTNSITNLSNSCTWASKLGTKGVGKTILSYIPPTIVNGEPIIHLQSSQFGEIQQKNANLIIGSFVSKKESFQFVYDIVTKAWKPKRKITRKFYGRKSFSFEFEDEEDKAQALEYGNFHNASQLFLVQPWKLFVEADLKNLDTIPIWVLFKKVPEELWNGKGFIMLASAIGKPLFPDRKTEQKSKTDYARICIEVKATSNFPTVVPVVVDKKRVFRVTTEYNWRPPRCMHCKVFGHSESNCSKVHKGKKQTVWAEKEKAVEEPAKVIEMSNVNEIIEVVEDAQKQHLEVMEEDEHEQESNGEITTSVIAPASPLLAEKTVREEGEIGNQKELNIEDVMVTSITPMTTSTVGGATIHVVNGVRILEDDEKIPESMKSIMEQVDLVNSRMSAFLDKNKGGSSQQTPTVDRVKQKTGGGRGRQKGVSSSKTISDATDDSSLGIRKSQREPIAPV